MKILYLTLQFYPAWFAGTEKFVLQLAQACQRRGHQVKVITYDARPPAVTVVSHSRQAVIAKLGKNLRQKIATVAHTSGVDKEPLFRLYDTLVPNRINTRQDDYEGIPVLAVKHTRGQRNPSLADTEMTRVAKHILRLEQPDLIHVAHPMRMVSWIQAAYEQEIPYLFTLTDYWILCPRNILLQEDGSLCAGARGGHECRRACSLLDAQRSQQRQQTIQPLLANAKRIIAPSHFLSKIMQENLGLTDLPVIPYGTDLQHLSHNQRTYRQAQPITFLFAARLVQEKGVVLLLQAFQRLANPTVQLAIYGAGPLIEAVQAAAQQDPRIHYGGIYRSQALAELLNQVDVVVVPSTWHENLPLIMQEAQAAGVPTLVADVGGMTECVTDGVNGFTFRVGDMADLQAKMQMIIDQPEILNGIKENMCNPKPGQYRVTSLAEEAALYLKEYEKILALSAE